MVNVFLDNEYDKVSNYLVNHFSLVTIRIDVDILSNYDLSLYELKSSKSLSFGRPNTEQPQIIEKLGKIMSPEQMLIVKENYLKILLDYETKNKVFIGKTNFLFTEDYSKIMSKDSRILVYDHRGNVPKDVMLNIASVALMMLSGNCDQILGYAYIQSVMRQYGKADFTFQMNGYLHIKLGENEPTLKYKSETLLTDFNSKSP